MEVIISSGVYLREYFCLRKKFLVFNLVGRNLKIKYRRSFLGFFWTLLAPMALACLYYFVFKVVMHVQIPHYLAFILCGVLPWSFFSQTLAEGMESLVVSQGLLSKIPIPLQVFPFVGTVTNFITLILATPILIGAAIVSGVSLSGSLVLLPYLLILLLLNAYNLSMALALLFVFFRDLRHILSLFLQLWFYATPVVFPESMIPAKYMWVLYANPIGTLFASFHSILVEGVWPRSDYLMIATGWSVLLFVATVLWKQMTAHDVVESL